MTSQDAQRHMEDITAQLQMLRFHEQTLIREIELLRPKIESKIVRPRVTKNLSDLSKNDLEIDLSPIKNADIDLIQARKNFYYATNELAAVKADIGAKEVMYQSYQHHVKQQFEKTEKKLTDEMIFDAFRKVIDIKGKTPEEETACQDIKDNLMKYLNAGKDKRLEIHETLQNIVKQHGG